MTRVLVLTDIDGVLADCRHRLHYQAEKDYDKFYGVEMANDGRIMTGIELIESLQRRLFHSDKTDLVFVTGRPERTRKMTELWLRGAYVMSDVQSEPMFMRKDGDYRPSDVVKVELIKAIKKQYKKEWDEFDLIYFVDDDPKNTLAVYKAFPTEITCITFGADRMLNNEVK